jgi:2-oxo-3-hexenedioate decarboxylase
MPLMLDPATLAHEFVTAYANTTAITPPSSRDASFDVSAAHAVEAELVKIGRANGRRTIGRKVGYANKAMWRVLKLQTLVWAAVYEDTVTLAPSGETTLTLGRRYSPRLEPEIVFKLKSSLGAGTTDASDVLGAVEWMALGFEIIDCPFAEWKFQPADFVAAFGLHAALVVGAPVQITPDRIPALVETLAAFPLRLYRGDELIEEGSGKNVLRSPALCLGELAVAAARQPASTPLDAGEIITTGTITAAQPIVAGQIWRAEVDELGLAPLAIRIC